MGRFNQMTANCFAVLAIVSGAACLEAGALDGVTEEGFVGESEQRIEYDETLLGKPFDLERQVWVEDTDGDGVPDVTEELEKTDPYDREDFEGNESDSAQVGFPAGTCRSTFRHAGHRLCIKVNVQNARTYRSASTHCRRQKSRVCTYEDLTYLYYKSPLDATYNPYRRWIGNMIDDNLVMIGNRSITFNNDPDRVDFEGRASKMGSRNFWCCHDDDG